MRKVIWNYLEKITWFTAKCALVIIIAVVFIFVLAFILILKEQYDLNVAVKKNMANNPFYAANYNGWKDVVFKDVGSIQIPEDWIVMEQRGVITITDETGKAVAYACRSTKGTSATEAATNGLRYHTFSDFLIDNFSIQEDTIEMNYVMTATNESIERYNHAYLSIITGSSKNESVEFIRITLESEQLIWIAFPLDSGNRDSITEIAEAVAFSFKH